MTSLEILICKGLTNCLFSMFFLEFSDLLKKRNSYKLMIFKSCILQVFFFMAIYHNASTISLLHNSLFVLGALPATMVRNIWLTAINPIDLVFSKECCSKKNKALPCC